MLFFRAASAADSAGYCCSTFWGVIWCIQKRLIAWTKANAENGTPIPEKAQRMARMAFLMSRANAFLSIPMLFFMAAASHYPMFGG